MSPSRGQDPVPTVPRQPPACPVLRDPLTWAPAPRAPAPWERALRCAGTSRPHPCCVFLPCGERWCGLSVGQAPETPPRRFGQIQSIRMLPGKRCAFINFKQKTAAEAAYEDMLVSTGLGGPTAPPGPCARRGCSSTDIFLPRTLTWREAGWCCSSSTPPTPRRAPGSAPRPAARGVSSPGGSCSQQTSTAHGEQSQPPVVGRCPLYTGTPSRGCPSTQLRSAWPHTPGSQRELRPLLVAGL